MKSIKSDGSTLHTAQPSPVTAAIAASSAVALDELRINSGTLWWLERHPEQAGRVDLVRHSSGISRTRLPPDFSCRSRVHEYGGGSYCVCAKGVYFVNDPDQQIYFLGEDNKIQRITHLQNARYADLVYDARHHRLVCVQEQHVTGNGAVNSLVMIDIRTGVSLSLSSDHDFYASPALSTDGSQLAWLCWNHPDMPWDATELWIAHFSDNGTLVSPRCVAGGDSVSVLQPEWSTKNELYFIDDRSGWWNLYRYHNDHTEALFPASIEFGLPQWVFGLRSYCLVDSHRILCSFIDNGINGLGILDTQAHTFTRLDTEFSRVTSICSNPENAFFIAALNNALPRVARLDLSSHAVTSIIHTAPLAIEQRYLSTPRSIEFNTRHGDTAHAIYYPPCNPDQAAGFSGRPPVIVLTHGGPTACSDSALDLRKQFWTSRGFALLDVNYSGSTGFGRDYRERLYRRWGIRDAEDCCDAALYLVEGGLADPGRLIIRGSSAGGYTVLCALTFHNVFSAGASYYGIGDLEALAQHTHKFESHYLENLVGPYPDLRETYRQRSPLYAADQLNCPVIFFQGLDDRVVPREQSERMFNTLKSKGVPTSYLEFPGEGHGFRKADTIKACLAAELEFYARVFGLPPDPERDGNLRIENLPD